MSEPAENEDVHVNGIERPADQDEGGAITAVAIRPPYDQRGVTKADLVAELERRGWPVNPKWTKQQVIGALQEEDAEAGRLAAAGAGAPSPQRAAGPSAQDKALLKRCKAMDSKYRRLDPAVLARMTGGMPTYAIMPWHELCRARCQARFREGWYCTPEPGDTIRYLGALAPAGVKGFFGTRCRSRPAELIRARIDQLRGDFDETFVAWSTDWLGDESIEGQPFVFGIVGDCDRPAALYLLGRGYTPELDDVISPLPPSGVEAVPMN